MVRKQKQPGQENRHLPITRGISYAAQELVHHRHKLTWRQLLSPTSSQDNAAGIAIFDPKKRQAVAPDT
jgi:hypothetical protein